jgi:hypothetical protein
VRLREVGPDHQRLLRELSSQISNRLETAFTNLPGADSPNIGVELVERGRRVVMEVPAALFERAEDDPSAREAIRVRIKAKRDRMLFRAPPVPLPKRIAAAPDPAGPRAGFGRFQGPGRGRR